MSDRDLAGGMPVHREAITGPEWEAEELNPLPIRKRNSHSKNAPSNQEELRAHLKRISGVDRRRMPALRVIANGISDDLSFQV